MRLLKEKSDGNRCPQSACVHFICPEGTVIMVQLTEQAVVFGDKALWRQKIEWFWLDGKG